MVIYAALPLRTHGFVCVCVCVCVWFFVRALRVLARVVCAGAWFCVCVCVCLYAAMLTRADMCVLACIRALYVLARFVTCSTRAVRDLYVLARLCAAHHTRHTRDWFFLLYSQHTGICRD